MAEMLNAIIHSFDENERGLALLLNDLPKPFLISCYSSV